MQFAMELGQIEYAREIISRSSTLNTQSYKDLLEYALIHDRPKFVELLIEEGNDGFEEI